MADGILNIPIQINGGTQDPDNNQNLTLLERELYVRETSDGYELYIGTGGSTPTNVGPHTAVKVLTIPYTQFVQADDNSITIGNIRFYKDPNGETTFSVDGKSITCKKATFYDLNLSRATLVNSTFREKIILTQGQNYGTALPATGEDGQLFFKIS